MSCKSPLFSIVIPTRNRAHLLHHALQSALEQTFDDYEIVVSDNYSSDNTPEVVRKLAAGRVRYFRTDTVLSMPDSWEFALSRAEGEWITFLCDDSALHPRLLEEVAGVIAKRQPRLISWANAAYYSDTWYESARRNQLAILPFTGHVVDVSSRLALSHLFALREPLGLPRTLNSCCHRKVINEVKDRQKRFFQPICPDYSSCAAMLSIVEKYTYIDMPLMVNGTGKESIGDSFDHGRQEAALAFLQEFQQQCIFEYVPLHTLVSTNCIADTLLRVKEAMSEYPSDVRLDWKKYFVQCYTEIRAVSRYGVDVSAEKAELFACLSQRPISFRADVCVRVMVSSAYALLRRVLRTTIDRSPILLSLIGGLGGRRAIRREDAGFTNSLEGARYLDTVVTKDLGLRNSPRNG